MAENLKNEFAHRTCLPSVMEARSDSNIWSLLKNCLGKDLCKVTMPVTLNEPLSFLQRICEYMEYANLLTIASQQEDPADRMKFVAGFAVSSLASNWERIGKPFNPLLGETYELQRNDYKIVCEQVSHHPPISAFHAESSDYKFYGTICPKIKFLGKTIEIQPKGTVTVELLRWKEAYSWSNVNCYVHNIVVGKLWIEQAGTMEITNHCNGYQAILDFKSAACCKEMCRVDGVVQDNRKQTRYYLYGRWNEFLKCGPENFDLNCKRKNNEEDTLEFAEIHSKRSLPKIHSFKMSSLFSLSIQDNENSAPSQNTRKDDDFLSCDDSSNCELLWKCNARPASSSEYYQFTTFAMQLNEMEPGMKPPHTLCPTDSRLRPDIKCLENGDPDGASLHKTRLEEKQRDAKRMRKNMKEDTWKPRWFTYSAHPYTKSNDWLYTGDYWKRDYTNVTEIF